MEAVLTVDGEARRTVKEGAACRDDLQRGLALGDPAELAVAALAARGNPREHDVVADRDVGDTLTNRGDDPGSFMPQHYRCSMLPLTAHHVQVAVAHPGCRDRDLDLVRAGWGELDRADVDGLAGAAEDSG